MLYLYESTKLISTLPFSNLFSALRSSMGWNEASCVTVPLLRVSREGCVTPLLEGLLLMTSAVRRNSLIWSFVSELSSAAGASNGVNTQARITIKNEVRVQSRSDSRMRCPSRKRPTLYAKSLRGYNSNRVNASAEASKKLVGGRLFLTIDGRDTIFPQ